MQNISKQIQISKELGNIMTTSYNLELINYASKNDVKSLVDFSEKMYCRQLQNIVLEILKGNYKFIFIAGPSGAGKTTSSMKIRKNLIKKGKKCRIISLDDFLIDKLDTPKLPDGSYDFENFTTLDLKELGKFIRDIKKLGVAYLPRYDFLLDKRNGYNKIKVEKDEIIIFEGIHALNEKIINKFKQSEIYKIYVAVSSNFIIGKDVVINSKQLRFMRRMLRDYYKRGTSVEESAKTWKNVCRGEDEFIDCYKFSVNYLLNTTHIYEPLLYDTYLSPLLKVADKERGILDILEIFKRTGNLKKDIVPKNSLIWEFLPKD